ncbi:hypothetical protein [Pseudonocardia sp. GCM10023141]|uniref:hypothetical protein n=1 Tax=Pseudonocardia sp. GCM10023141 TaxID=3252653 RepID=UPI003619974C
MTTWPGDALFGQDGTGDGVGPLPGFELPVVRLPTIGLDGEITGLDELDADLDAGAEAPPASRPPVAPPVALREPPAPATPPSGARPANAGQVVSGWRMKTPPAPVAEPERRVDPPPDATAPPKIVRPEVAHTEVAAFDEPTRDPGLPVERRPVPVARLPRPSMPAPNRLPPRPEARPRVVDDGSLLGLTRHSRSKIGSRLFTWFFVAVFALILIQMIAVLMNP